MPPKKRQRIVLVCDNCHHRKIKCDRKLPCDSCTARGITSLCKYTAIERELEKQGKAPEASNHEVMMLRTRIKELEALIGVASLGEGLPPGALGSFQSLGGPMLMVSPMESLYGVDSLEVTANGGVPGAGTGVAVGALVPANGANGSRSGSNAVATTMAPTTTTTTTMAPTTTGGPPTTTGPIIGPTTLPATLSALGAALPPTDPSSTDPSPTTTNFFLSSGDFGCIQLQDAFAACYPFLLSWLLKSDSAFKVFWHYNRLSAQNDRFCRHLKEGVVPLLEGSGGDDTAVHSRAREMFGSAYIPTQMGELGLEIPSNVSPDEQTKQAINQYLAPNAVLFYPGYLLPSSSVYVQLSAILPPKFIILQYLNVWFNVLDPLFPILERSSFYNDVDALVQQVGESVTINVEKKLDLPRLAALLLVLRLTYLYTSKVESSTTNAYQLLDQYPIYCDVVSIARETLKEFSLNNNHSFEVLQAFVLSKVVKTYSPEEGDSVKDTDVFISTLVHNACACGLSRDPDIFSHDNISWIQRTHRRKFWYFLISHESLELIMFGRKLYNIRHSDVKLEEINNPGDNTMYEYMKKMLPSRLKIKQIMDSVLDLHQPVDLTVFQSQVHELEAIITSFNVAESLPLRTLETLWVSTLKLFVLKTHFSLYMIYERKKMVDQLFYYYKKFLHLLYVDLEPTTRLLDSYNGSEDAFSLLLGSLCVRSQFIQVVISISTIIHLNYTIKMYIGTDKPEHLYGMIRDMGIICRNLVKNTGKLSKKYFGAWRATKAILYAYDETKGLATFEDVCHGESALWIFRTEQMHEICELLEHAVSSAAASATGNVPLDIQWLELLPYDGTKLVLENLLDQRAHALQVDAIWHNYATSLQEAVPVTYKGDEGAFTLEDIFLDGFYKF